jgi:hypothetical protein
MQTPLQKKCNQRSSRECSIPTLQTLGKQEQARNKKLAKKHQKAQVQAQYQNPAKSNQATIDNIQRTGKKEQQANYNNMNRQARTTTTSKQQISAMQIKNMDQ